MAIDNSPHPSIRPFLAVVCTSSSGSVLTVQEVPMCIVSAVATALSPIVVYPMSSNHLDLDLDLDSVAPFTQLID